MLHWTIWDREPGVHEASLRRYVSKLVYHITVYFLFTLVIVTCKYSTLTQLTYHFASYNSCSNWRPPTSMQAWHWRTRFCGAPSCCTYTCIYSTSSHEQPRVCLTSVCMSATISCCISWSLDWKERPYSMACEVTWPESPSLFSIGIFEVSCVWDPSGNGHGISCQNCSCLWY